MQNHEVEVAFNEMINKFRPTNLISKGSTTLFDGFPTAMLGFGVAVGGIFVGLCVYWLITWIFVGHRAWDIAHVPKGWTLRDEIIRDKYGSDIYNIRQYEPNLVEIRRPRWSGIGHSVAIILGALIFIFGVYAAFFVCGIDPAILVGLGVVSLVVGYGLSDLVVEIRDALRIHSSGMLQEGDNIIPWATKKAGQVSFMGATRFNMEEINENGDLLVHHMGYRQLLAGGFSRYETGGEKYVHRYKEKEEEGKNKVKARQNILLKPNGNPGRKKKK